MCVIGDLPIDVCAIGGSQKPGERCVGSLL